MAARTRREADPDFRRVTRLCTVHRLPGRSWMPGRRAPKGFYDSQIGQGDAPADAREGPHRRRRPLSVQNDPTDAYPVQRMVRSGGCSSRPGAIPGGRRTSTSSCLPTASRQWSRTSSTMTRSTSPPTGVRVKESLITDFEEHSTPDDAAKKLGVPTPYAEGALRLRVSRGPDLQSCQSGE